MGIFDYIRKLFRRNKEPVQTINQEPTKKEDEYVLVKPRKNKIPIQPRKNDQNTFNFAKKITPQLPIKAKTTIKKQPQTILKQNNTYSTKTFNSHILNAGVNIVPISYMGSMKSYVNDVDYEPLYKQLLKNKLKSESMLEQIIINRNTREQVLRYRTVLDLEITGKDKKGNIAPLGHANINGVLLEETKNIYTNMIGQSVGNQNDLIIMIQVLLPKAVLGSVVFYQSGTITDVKGNFSFA